MITQKVRVADDCVLQLFYDSRFSIRAIFSRPFHGLTKVDALVPSTEVLGYFQFVRFADTCRQSQP